ncbi:MAG: ferredoxin family protein [Chloroflexota bacterium]|nr:MAG: ferredoxin family protein [Chloroflexota bacterium]
MAAKGTITIDAVRCKGCTYCTDACPYHLIEMGKQINSFGYQTAVYIDADRRCTACTLCAITCPDVAIDVYKKKG